MADQNYYRTFIEVAEDCPVRVAAAPTYTGAKTMPVLQYEMIAGHPYRYTQEDVLFEAHAEHKGIPQAQRGAARTGFFSKGQPCLRASALGKRYGWGIHCDDQGRVALYPVESKEYTRLASDTGITHLRAMRSRRA